MRITDITMLEDCFDGSSTYRYTFSEAWTRDGLRLIEPMGRLDYYADFPRPFFRLTGSGGFQVKGVAGEDTCLLILPGKGRDHIKRSFEDKFEHGSQRAGQQKGDTDGS